MPISNEARNAALLQTRVGKQIRTCRDRINIDRRV